MPRCLVTIYLHDNDDQFVETAAAKCRPVSSCSSHRAL
jgi:hypothetical protein